MTGLCLPRHPRHADPAPGFVQDVAQRSLYILVLCSMMLLVACTGKVELLTNVTDTEGNEALTVLLNAGLTPHKHVTKDGVSIRVNSHEIAHALEILKSHGLPRERFDGMGDIFRKEGLVSSPLEERARYLYALSQELANTLTQVDGVLTARVHAVLPERGNIGETTTPSTAAVFIKHRRDVSLDALQPQIRSLVTHSIPDLDESQVTVLLIPAQPIVQNAGNNNLAEPASLSMGSILTRADTATTWLLLVLLGLAMAGLALAGRLAWTRTRRDAQGQLAEARKG